MEAAPVLEVSTVKPMDPADLVPALPTVVVWMVVKLKDRQLVPMDSVYLLSFVMVITAKLYLNPAQQQPYQIAT